MAQLAADKPDEDIDIQKHYSYKGEWKLGVKHGFGIENFDIAELILKQEEYFSTMHKTQSILQNSTIDNEVVQNYCFYPEPECYETKYIGFFINNKKVSFHFILFNLTNVLKIFLPK